MCGIVGFRTDGTRVSEDILRHMTDAIAHRGPDDAGFHVSDPVGLGMRRLSIIDVATGHQPVSNEDGTITVVFNGEIYNYVELREELVARGHRFRTSSDTEVLVHLYEERGPGFLAALNGMFAIALWDAPRQRLVLARDRIGEKPLYLHEGPRGLVFGSEVKALLQHPLVPRELDRTALREYLALGYVRGERTLFRGIRRLRPGHVLVVGPEGRAERPYWTLQTTVSRVGFEEATAKTLDLLQDAIRLQLRSDVPVGAFLSGGLDSSTVVTFAARNTDIPLRTFSVGFGPGSFDELGYARTVAEAAGTDHHELQVRVGDAIERLPSLVWHLDEPNADSAVIPTYLVSEFAARTVKVVLTGAGGDEVFGGYPRYYDGLPAEHVYRRAPRAVRRIVAGASVALPKRLGDRLRWNALDDEERFREQVAFVPRDVQDRLAPGPAVDFRSEYAAFGDGDAINRRMFADLQTYLPDDILHLTDRMSMAVSLEARAPLLDYRLAELSMSLPGSYKVLRSPRRWKVLLKEAVRPHLPASIIDRPKWGFGAPVRAWMDDGLDDLSARILREGTLVTSGTLSREGVTRNVSTPIRDDRSAQVRWSLLVLETWARVFLSKELTRPDYDLEALL